jgi:periplasmic protein TonB
MMRFAGTEFDYAREKNRHRATKVALVVAAHLFALYALTRDTVQAQIARVITAQIVSIELPTPKPTVEIPREPKPQKQIVESPAPKLAYTAPPTPTTSMEVVAAAPQIVLAEAARETPKVETVTTTQIAIPATSPPPPVQQLPPKIELPSSSADYLNNPAPPYPPQSKRLGEQGRVLLRVYVSEEGLPRAVELKQSCGYERLDDIALATVKKWKFVPGKRNGVAEAMWVNVPLVFELT